MTAILGRVIFGIPLVLVGLVAKGGAKLFAVATTFLAEIIGILLFKAKWYVAALCWLFILYGLVLLDPFVARYAPVIHGFYNRIIITVGFLMVMAFITRNLRRAFRRARLEVKVLSAMSEGRKQIQPVVQRTGTGARGLFDKFIASAKRVSEVPVPVHEVVVTVPTGGDPSSETYEETAAKMAAQAQAEVNTGLSGGDFPNKERPDWMKAKPKKSGGKSKDNKKAHSVDPLIRAKELEEEARRLRGERNSEDNN